MNRFRFRLARATRPSTGKAQCEAIRGNLKHEMPSGGEQVARDRLSGGCDVMATAEDASTFEVSSYFVRGR